MTTKKKSPPPRDRATVAAWMRVDSALWALRSEAALRHPDAAGIREFVAALREMCVTVSKNAGSRPSFSALVREFEGGFGRRHRRVQDAPRVAAREWVVAEWDAHHVSYAENKSAFARDYAGRLKNERGMVVDVRTIKERWLKGR